MRPSINLFLHRYRNGTLDEDATWRAYDILATWQPKHTQRALKAIGLKYAGELALRQFMALYEVPDAVEAEKLLACWWLWSEIARGGFVRVPLRASGGGHPSQLDRSAP